MRIRQAFTLKMSDPKPTACPVRHDAAAQHPLVAPTEGGCPLRNNEPNPGQAVHPDQRLPLSKSRQVSSIPKTENFTPQHQPSDGSHWTYPSEQMFYNALRRKGYAARDEDIPAVVAIHNAVNEKSWTRVMAWESMHESYVVLLRVLLLCGCCCDFVGLCWHCRCHFALAASVPTPGCCGSKAGPQTSVPKRV